jgi:hypothetical protein
MIRRLWYAFESYCSVLPVGRTFGAFYGVFGAMIINHYLRSKFPKISFLMIFAIAFLALFGFVFLLSFIIRQFGWVKDTNERK